MTVLDLIKSSLRLIGQLGPGRTPGASELSDALLVLNTMLEAWSVERLNVFSIGRDVYDLVPGKQTYTLGPGGDFDNPRPVRIERAGIVALNNPSQPFELPLKLLRTAEEWADVRIKDLPSTLPKAAYNDNAFPLANFSLWPVPSIAHQVAIYPWRALTTGFDDSGLEVEFPPGYADAIRYNLAVRLAPEWGKELRPEVLELARLSRTAIQSLNSAAEAPMSCEVWAFSGRRIFNWITGE